MTVQIEPHATINMLKQRVALLVAAQTKHQRITNEAGLELDDVSKLEDCEGVVDNAVMLLHVEQPKEEVKVIEPLSDDEDLMAADNDEAEPLPQGDAATKELTDEDADRQNALKGAAAELLEDGDKSGALAKLTEAVMVGNPSAMMLSKRSDLLLKMKRPKAAMSDATAALALNPDSGKAYRIRGKARRYVGDYAGAKADLDLAQGIDYDDDVADLHTYVKKRSAKIAALAAAEGSDTK